MTSARSGQNTGAKGWRGSEEREEKREDTLCTRALPEAAVREEMEEKEKRRAELGRELVTVC